MTHLTLAFRVSLTVLLLFALIIPSSLAVVNPFTHPAKGEVVRLGTVFNITWTPTKGDTLNIELWQDSNGQGGGARSLGYMCPGLPDTKYCGLIAEKIKNKGFYEWSLFGATGAQGEYWLDMYYSGTGWDGTRPAMANSTSEKFQIVYNLQSSSNNAGQTVFESSSPVSTPISTKPTSGSTSTVSSTLSATTSSSPGTSNFRSRVEDWVLAIVLLGLALVGF